MADLPQPDPTTGLYNFTAKTNSGDVNRFSVGDTTPVRFVDNRTGTPRIVDFGVGPTAAANAAAAAQATSDDSKGRANWQIQTGDASGNWSTVGIDKPDPKSLLQQVADVALPVATAFIPGIGPIAAGLLGAGTSAGLNGLEGNSGSQTLIGALTGGLGAGALNATLPGIIGALNGGSNALTSAASNSALNLTTPSVSGGLVGTDLSGLSGATAAGAGSSAVFPLSGVDVVTGAGGAGSSAIPAIATALGGAGAVAAGAGSPGTANPDGSTPVSGVDVTVPRIVSPNPGLLTTPVVQPLVSQIDPTIPNPNLTPSGKGVSPADLAKLALLAGATGSGTPSTATGTGTPTPLNPIFTAKLPDASPWAVNTPLPTQNLDWAHYGSGPEAQFFTDTQRAPGGNGPLMAKPFDATAAVTQDYQNILGRAPDASGLSFWVNQANQAVGSGVRPEDEINNLIASFQASPEGKAKTTAAFAVGGVANAPPASPSSTSFAVKGPGAGRSDSIPAKLSDGEYVMDAETVSMLGDGSSKAGAAKLDRFRANVRKHKGANLVRGRFSANAKEPEAYLSGGRI